MQVFGTWNKGVIAVYLTVDTYSVVIKANTVETDPSSARRSLRDKTVDSQLY